jgi:hypothetical protein
LDPLAALNFCWSFCLTCEKSNTCKWRIPSPLYSCSSSFGLLIAVEVVLVVVVVVSGLQHGQQGTQQGQ